MNKPLEQSEKQDETRSGSAEDSSDLAESFAKALNQALRENRLALEKADKNRALVEAFLKSLNKGALDSDHLTP